MSSYKDFIKKWNGEYIEPEQKTSSTKRESNASESAGYQRFIEKYNPTVDESYINSFLSDFNTYSSKAKSDYDSLNWNSATSSGLVKSYEDTSFDLAFRSGMIRSHLWLNKDSIDEKEYNNLVSRLDDIEGYSKDVTKAFTDARDYYSQWNTQKDYDDFVAYQKDYEAKKSFDISAGEKEVAELEGILSEYKKLTRFTTDENGARRAEEIFQQYGDEKSIKALISQKKQYLNQAKHIQDGITLSGVVDNADFKENSGYSSTESDSKWGKLTSQYGLGYEDLTYEYINGAHNGMREEILHENRSYSIDTGLDTSENWKIYDNMTESEIAIYNYHYAKDGKEAAEKYLKSIQETLNMREATSMYSNMEDKTALEIAFGVAAGLDQFKSGMKNLFNTEDDYIAQSAYQIASGMVREDLADVGPNLPDWLGGGSRGQMGYDAVTTTANMAPSILTSMAANLLAPGSGAIIGAGMMGASAAGNDYQQMLNLGYTKEQARMHSALVGASEAGLQYFLGGIGALGGKVSGGVLTKIMNGIDNAFLRTAIKLGGSMVSEGLEEGLQEILTTWFQNLVMYTDEDVDWSEVAYSSLLGALTAGFMEGPSTIYGEVSVYNTGRQLQDADISAQRLAEIGSTFSADTVAYQLASRVDESTGAYTMGRLFNEIGATLTEQNVNDITEALVEKGMDRGTAKKNARAMAKIVEGGNLTDLQVAVIESNEVLAEAVRTTIIEQNATWFQRTKGYNDALMALAQEKTDPNATQTNLAQATEGNGEVGVDGISEADTGPSSVKSISDIKDGQVTIKLDNDSEVNLREADLDPDDGVTIETIASIAGISAADANFILNTLRTNPGASAQMASLGAKEAYKYGYYGFSKDHMTQHGVFANSLNETQRQAIYETGRNARASTVAAKQATVAKNATADKSEAVAYKNEATGRVHFDGDRSTLTERQSASLTAMEKVAEILGVQIHVFESEVNEKGKRIGANGWYDPNDNSIHIDLHAGANGEGTMMFTLAHELTHHIRKWSPEKFKILADFLMEEYGKKGVNIDALVRAQIEKAWATRKRKISYDTAYEEVVADSMETMLADGNVLNRLEKLKAKDESLWKEIKRFINELADKIHAVYKKLKPDSYEGKIVADMGKAVYRLQELFAEALVDASENYQASEQIGIEIDAETESVSPEVAFSERTWTESDYVQEREKAAAEIAKAIGVSKKKAKAYIDSVNSIAKMIAEDRVRLDYFSSPGRSSFVGNVEYGGSFDFSTLCKKRRLLTGTFTAIQRALPNTALTADEILDIRNRMKEKGLEVSCGLCYVEGSRANMGQFAKEFLRLYKKYYPDAWQPNMADVNTPDGIEWVRINHPECYEQYEYFWNHYGTLKDGDKNLFASQQKPKLYQLHTEYKGEILEKFKDDGNVENKNLNGGIRLQSFSDFEIVHLIDTMQIIMDMSRVGLAGQAYTKVPDFAWALGDTGLKINLSLIAKGVDENGKLIFDDVEGMPIDTAVELRNRYSKNVGTILVAFNDEQLLAAMADDRVDYIIPFHRSQWKKSQYAAMGLPAKTKDYTYMQNEKFIKPQYHEYRGRMVQDKAINYMPNEYWDFSKSGKENAIAYLEMCARNNKRPKFYKLLQNNGDGSYSLKADGSTDGYWKLLIDFKMYDNDGKGSPQMPVKPEFNMEEATRMLDTYQGGHSNFPVAQGIVDDFVKDYKDSHKDVLYSDRVTDPDTLDFLNEQLRNGEVTEVYRAMAVDGDRNLYPPMAGYVTKNGKKVINGQPSVIGVWEQSTESIPWETVDEEFLLSEGFKQYGPTKDYPNGSFKKDNNIFYRNKKGEWKSKFHLEKDNGSAVDAAYAPYIHTSLSMLNDQFTSAYKRDNLVVVRGYVPNSEINGVNGKRYQANFADKPVGRTKWHSGVVAAQMPETRTVILSRYFMPIEIVDDAVMAQKTKEMMKGKDIEIPFNVVTPRQRRALEAIGVRIGEARGLKDPPKKADVMYSDRDTAPTYQNVVSKAVETFGTTTEFAEAGFILPDGKMLKFTDDNHSGERQYDHRAIGLAYGVDVDLNVNHGFNYESNNHLDDFVENGSIRFDPGSMEFGMDSGMQLSKSIPITKEQEMAIRDFVEWKKQREEMYNPDDDPLSLYDGPLTLHIDFGGGSEFAVSSSAKDLDAWGVKHLTYEGGQINASRIIADIRHYYRTGETRKQSTVAQFLYSERDTESVSNRSLLANAFDGVAQSDIERNKIKEYKSKISLIESEERKLSKLNQKIKDLSFAKGPRDTQAIRDLQFEAKQTANRINTYDKQLLRLEASKPLQDVLQREKKAAYQRAEKKGKEALEKYREKATKTQRELLDKWQDSRKRGIESREKTAMRHKIQRVVGELNQLLLNGDKNRHVPENMKKAVADALSLVNMDTVGAEERAAKYAALIAKETDPDKIDAYTVTMENILRQGDKMGQRLKELRDAYEEIQGSDDPDIANAYDPVIAGALSELSQSIGNTSLRNMTLEQLSDVYDVYRMVLTRVRDANKAFLNEMRENISNLASRVIGEVRMAGGEHKYRAAILDPARKFLWNNLKPVYAMEHIGSSTLANVFDNVRAGEDVWAKDVTEARDYYLDKSKKYGYDSWDFKKKYRFESNDGTVFDLTLDQILSLYAYSKREQAHDHLRLGGFVFDSNIETYKEKGSKLIKYKVNTADAHQITPEILANIIGKLSDKQKAFVDEMQDYLSTTMGAKGNEVTMKMYGVKLFKEKFYFPLKSAKQFMFEQNQVSGEVKIKNSGFTNKVVAKANNPVILNNFMDVWSGHVNDMSMYHAFVLPLEDFNRVFNYNSPKKENQPSVSVKGTIQNSYSPAAVDYVKNLITDLNGGARGDSTTGFINKMMGLFKKGSVFASLSVVVQQPSAIARAVALVDTKYFIGPKVDHKSHKALWEEVKKYAPVAIIKEMGYFDTNMGKSTQDFIQGKEYSSIGSKMKALFTDSGYRDEALAKAPALADEIAWCSIWEAVKRETKAKHKGMNTKSDEFLKMAGKRFTEVIVKTQVYDSVLSRSANMRSKDTGMKMATAFMAEPTTSINMIADALLKGKRGNKKYARSAIGAVIASQILNSILVSFVYAGRDDDEDKTYLEKYIGTLAGQTLDSLNPAGYIPFIKDIMSIVQGYDVERSDMAVVSDLWKAWQDLQKDDVSVYRKVEGFVGSIAQIFGLPVKNIMRDARGIYQTIDSFMNGQQTTKAGIEYAVKSAMPAWAGGGEVSDQTQLYEAYINGDQEQIARVKGIYKDASAVSSAIRKALRENDPRIREAAIAWNANDLNKYMRIAKAIIAERHFSQDDVVMAIRAEANSLAPEKETSSTAKAKGLFTTEKFAEAIAKGDQATANAIKSDIIKTAQKNGKTEEEAEKSFNSSASGDCKELFLEGKLSESKAINALLNYCGLEQEDAEKRVGEWAFQKEYGFYYSDRGDAYKNGAISKDELKDILMDVGGKTEEEAEWQIKVYDWQSEGYDVESTYVIQDYEEFCEPAGIDKGTYYDAYLFYKDAGETGVAYSKTIECVPYIDSLPLTSAQKTALALCWWAEATVRKYKTW